MYSVHNADELNCASKHQPADIHDDSWCGNEHDCDHYRENTDDESHYENDSHNHQKFHRSCCIVFLEGLGKLYLLHALSIVGLHIKACFRLRGFNWSKIALNNQHDA